MITIDTFTLSKNFSKTSNEYTFLSNTFKKYFYGYASPKNIVACVGTQKTACSNIPMTKHKMVEMTNGISVSLVRIIARRIVSA